MSQAGPVSNTETSECAIAVRYGFLFWVGQFRHSPDLVLASWTNVVVQTERGIEIGTTVPFTCPAGCQGRVSQELIDRYVERSGPEYLRPDAGQISRLASPDDLAEQRKINEQAEEKMTNCQTMADEADLKMRLVACEHLLGGERIVFYFTADGRVDFRQLVRDLARQYHTRIEMRQIGARDEARIVADYEICGRECCCKNFLKVLRPVNMRMAKLQKATLDPTKVSGRCGRLRCCLRFEQRTYEQLDASLPRIGQTVQAATGTGVVKDRQIITQLLVLDMGGGKRLAVPVEELLEVGPSGEQPVPSEPTPQAEDEGDLDLPTSLRGADFDDEESTLLSQLGAEPDWEEEPSDTEEQVPPEPTEKPAEDAAKTEGSSAKKSRRRSRRSRRRNRPRGKK